MDVELGAARDEGGGAGDVAGAPAAAASAGNAPPQRGGTPSWLQRQRARLHPVRAHAARTPRRGSRRTLTRRGEHAARRRRRSARSAAARATRAMRVLHGRRRRQMMSRS
jgi:hypothetical protein